MPITSIIAIMLVPASQAPQAAHYPEFAQDRLLSAIVADIRQTIPDPYSVRDFLLCPPSKVKLKNGRPVGWTVTFAFNSKNEAGGYTGVKSYAVGFKEGRISLHTFSSDLPGKDAFDKLINQAVLKQRLQCPAIPNKAIRELLADPVPEEDPR